MLKPVLVLSVFTLLLPFESTVADDPLAFARNVRPLLSDRCFACHGPDEEHREADLRFDQAEGLQQDRGGYQVIDVEKPNESELLKRVFSSDEDEVMPPPGAGQPLTDAEKNTLRQWIAQGAEWKQHWAYELPKPVSVPDVEPGTRCDNWIDAFIAKEHRSATTDFSPAADPVTLARRLSFDLVGLPPTIEQIARLKARAEPEIAIAELTEELLAASGFGEHLATYWLDLVRFADTVGYHGDQDHNVSPYRDYVIDAFNDNMPFDRFTIEQLAGDLLEDPTEEQIVATAYNRLLQTSHEGGVQPQEYLTIYQADRVRNFSAVWMGATVGCAQCHDHKYDPYLAKDFYSLAAFFADVDEAQHFKLGSNALPTKRPPERKFLSRSERLRLEQLTSRITAELDSSETDSSEIKALESEIDWLKKNARVAMYTASIEPREVRFLPRGDWLDESGEVMSPAVPEFLPPVSSAHKSSRLDLAKWLVDTESGVGLLTARVMVNRIWMRLFGTGLSRSVEDFGGQGEPPTHPELLDQLALEFVRTGFDIKSMIRLIVSSRTYRQSSFETEWHLANDPTNRLYARQNRYRLPSEVVRDTALACGDLLVSEIGGASVKPYQPAGYYRHLNFPTRKYSATANSGQWRRGVYVHWQRQFLHPMLKAFDAPTREECTAQRSQSNTPLAALVLLNDETFFAAAKGLAQRIRREHLGTAPAPELDTAAINVMFQIVLSRDADEVESTLMLELLEASRGGIVSDEAAASNLRETNAAHDEWTTVARAVLNLGETYSRN